MPLTFPFHDPRSLFVVDATFTCFSRFFFISFPLIYEDTTSLVRSPGTHLNNIFSASAADHSMHCFRRWTTYETWWVGCMNYLRPSLLSFSLFHVSIPFSQNASCDGPCFWGSSRSTEGTVKDIFFSILALYCMTLNFGHVGVGRIFDLYSPLVTSWFFPCFQFLLCEAA